MNKMADTSSILKFLFTVSKLLGLFPFEFVGEKGNFHLKSTRRSFGIYVFVFLIIMSGNILFHLHFTINHLQDFTSVSTVVVAVVNVLYLICYLMIVVSLILSKNNFTFILKQFSTQSNMLKDSQMKSYIVFQLFLSIFQLSLSGYLSTLHLLHKKQKIGVYILSFTTFLIHIGRIQFTTLLHLTKCHFNHINSELDILAKKLDILQTSSSVDKNLKSLVSTHNIMCTINGSISSIYSPFITLYIIYWVFFSIFSFFFVIIKSLTELSEFSSLFFYNNLICCFSELLLVAFTCSSTQHEVSPIH